MFRCFPTIAVRQIHIHKHTHIAQKIAFLRIEHHRYESGVIWATPPYSRYSHNMKVVMNYAVFHLWNFVAVYGVFHITQCCSSINNSGILWELMWFLIPVLIDDNQRNCMQLKIRSYHNSVFQRVISILFIMLQLQKQVRLTYHIAILYLLCNLSFANPYANDCCCINLWRSCLYWPLQLKVANFVP